MGQRQRGRRASAVNMSRTRQSSHISSWRRASGVWNIQWPSSLRVTLSSNLRVANGLPQATQQTGCSSQGARMPLPGLGVVHEPGLQRDRVLGTGPLAEPARHLHFAEVELRQAALSCACVGHDDVQLMQSVQVRVHADVAERRAADRAA